MEKLQPILKQHFWICFGFSLLLPFIGWWMASGSLTASIDDRRKAIDAAESAAKQAAVGRPNEHWVVAATAINDQDVAEFKGASNMLRDRQAKAREWPSVLREKIEVIGFNEQINDSVLRGRWAAIYDSQYEAIMAIVRPYKNGEGLVLVDQSKVTHKQSRMWRVVRPKSKEVWNNQEDLWLLKSLLKSIARVNEGANRITDASVREIRYLQLRGGDPDAKPVASGGSGGMGDDRGMSAADSGGFGGATSGGGTTGDAQPWLAFMGSTSAALLDEEFGAEAGSTSGTGGETGFGSGAAGELSGDDMDGTAGAAADSAEDRYVHDDPSLNFKTRAFELCVRVRGDQIPALLTSLTDSDFPVEIVRLDVNTVPVSSGGFGGGGGIGGLGDSFSETGGLSESGGGLGVGLGVGSSAGNQRGGFTGDFGGFNTSNSQGSSNDSRNRTFGGGGGGSDRDLGIGSGMTATDENESKEGLGAALSDPYLVTLRVGGLMTIYLSDAETKAEEKSDEVTAEETKVEGPSPGDVPETDTTTAPDEGSVPADGTAPATDTNGGVPGATADGAPAEGTPTEAAPADTPATESPDAGTPAGDTQTAPTTERGTDPATATSAGDAATGDSAAGAAPSADGTGQDPPGQN